MKPETITPDKTSMRVDVFFRSLGNSMVNNTAVMPNKKANACMPMHGRCSKIARAAPTPAPYETPSKSGETRGLRNIPWYATPERAKAEPVKIAATVRGSRITITTSRILSVHVCSIAKRLDDKIRKTCENGTVYLPHERDIMIRNSNSRNRPR